jgi:hypothetical protein
MIMLSDVGGLSGVRSALNSVKVPPDVINNIVSVLEETSRDLDLGHGHFRKPDTQVFGGTYSAEYLGAHTAKAHRKLSNSVLEAVASLQATGQAMVDFDKEISATDANSQDATQALLSRTQAAVDSLDDNRHTPPVTPSGESGSGQ